MNSAANVDLSADFHDILSSLLDDADFESMSSLSVSDEEKDPTSVPIKQEVIKREVVESRSEMLNPSNDILDLFFRAPGNSMFLGKKVKRAKRKVKELTLGRPRLVRTDIRDNYSRMFVASVNTNKFDRILSWCKDFITPDAECFVRKQLPQGPNLYFTASNYGPMWLANFIFTSVSFFPDLMCSLERSTVHADSASGAVCFTISIAMTKLYNVPTIHEVLPSNVIDTLPNGKKIGTNEVSGEAISSSMEAMKAQLKMRKIPQNLQFQGRILMYTGASHKRCNKISMDFSIVVNDGAVEA